MDPIFSSCIMQPPVRRPLDHTLGMADHTLGMIHKNVQIFPFHSVIFKTVGVGGGGVVGNKCRQLYLSSNKIILKEKEKKTVGVYSTVWNLKLEAIQLLQE